jgi:hypothetical protein
MIILSYIFRAIWLDDISALNIWMITYIRCYHLARWKRRLSNRMELLHVKITEKLVGKNPLNSNQLHMSRWELKTSRSRS